MQFRKTFTLGDRRMNHMVASVVERVLGRQELFRQLVSLIDDEGELVRMRAADAAEKVTRSHPKWLQPYADQLVHGWSNNSQQEVRWHVAAMLPRVQLTPAQRQTALHNLEEWLQPSTKSTIVRVFALQALFDMQANNIRDIIAKTLAASQTPASLRNRALKLQKKL